MDDPADRVAKLNIIVANRVAADDAAFRFDHLRKATTNNLFKEFLDHLFLETPRWIARKPVCRPWRTHHSAKFAGRNLPERKWIVDDRRKEVHVCTSAISGLADTPRRRRWYQNQRAPSISWPPANGANGIQQPWTQLRRSTRCLDHGRQFSRLGSSRTSL